MYSYKIPANFSWSVLLLKKTLRRFNVKNVRLCLYVAKKNVDEEILNP